MVRSTRSVIPIRPSFEQIRARAITTRKLAGRSLRNQLTVAVAVQLFIFQWLARSDAGLLFRLFMYSRAADCSQIRRSLNSSYDAGFAPAVGRIW